jgi:hypothetical protein
MISVLFIPGEFSNLKRIQAITTLDFIKMSLLLTLGLGHSLPTSLFIQSFPSPSFRNLAS